MYVQKLKTVFGRCCSIHTFEVKNSPDVNSKLENDFYEVYFSIVQLKAVAVADQKIE